MLMMTSIWVMYQDGFEKIELFTLEPFKPDASQRISIGAQFIV